MLKEVKEKIKLINKQMKVGGPISILGQAGATAEAADIIEESAYDSNGEAPMNPVSQLQLQQPGMQPHLQHQAAGKKKKSASKGAKKKSAGQAAAQ